MHLENFQSQVLLSKKIIFFFHFLIKFIKFSCSFYFHTTCARQWISFSWNHQRIKYTHTHTHTKKRTKLLRRNKAWATKNKKKNGHSLKLFILKKKTKEKTNTNKQYWRVRTITTATPTLNTSTDYDDDDDEIIQQTILWFIRRESQIKTTNKTSAQHNCSVVGASVAA